MSYELCPEPYYGNCMCSMVGCSGCKAADPSLDLPLKYRPINKSLGRKGHPCSQYMKKEKQEKDRQHRLEKAEDIKKGRSYKNKGAKNERRMASKLGADLTEASGALNRDGDLVMEAGPVSFHIECKYRGNGRNESGPTKRELEKAVNQGVSCFCTTSPTYPNGVYTLTHNKFYELINALRDAYQ